MTENKNQTAESDDQPAVVIAEEPAKVVADAEDPLAELKQQVADGQRQLQEERVRRQLAETAAVETQGKLRKSIDGQMAASFQAADNGIHAWETALDADKAAMAKAYEAGNFNEVSEIQVRMAQAAVELRVLRERKQGLERRRDQLVKQAEEAAKRQPVEQPVEGQMTAATKAWIDAHPQVLAPAEWNKAIALHEYGTRVKNLAPDTKEYFDFIEEGMGYKQQQPQQPPSAERHDPPRTSTAAPPSRGNGNGGPRTPRTDSVTLTREEQEFAKTQSSLGKTEKERLENYGRNKLALIKEGRIQGNA